MKKALDTGDWCRYKDDPRLFWISSVADNILRGYFALPGGTCYPVWFDVGTAKACTQKEIDKHVKEQLSLKQDTMFKRWRAKGGAFVDKATRQKYVRTEKKRLEAELKENT